MTIFLVILSLAVLIIVHELGHFGAAKLFNIKVEKFGIGFPPKIIGKKIGETEYSINLLPLGGFVKIYGEDPEEPINEEDKARSFAHQPAWKRAVVLVAGVTMNIILGWFALTIIFTTGVPEHLMISQVADNSPAEEAGVEAGDIILKAEAGETIFTNPVRIQELIELTQTHPGETVMLTLERGEKIIETSAFVRPDPPAGQGAMGVALVNIGFPSTPFPQNIIEGTRATGSSLKLITVGFYNLITGIFTNPEIVDSVSGPIGILAIATRAGDLGIIYLMQLMALISLNLAVLNLIPFPALDGGQLIILAIEKITRREVPFRTKAIVNTVGIAALLLLMVVVTVKDVGNLLN